MITNHIRKFISKIAIFGLLITMLAPVATTVQANDTGDLTIGINLPNGGFTLTEVADVGNTVHMTGTECSPQPVNGYHTCQFLGLSTGAYTIVFDPVVGYTTPDAVELMLSTAGAAIYGNYAVLGPDTGDLTVGVNIELAEFTITQVGSPNPPVTIEASTCSDPIDGYRICQFLALETGAYTIDFTQVVGYETPETVELMLGTEGAEVFADYLLLGPDTGDLTIGINLPNGGFTLTEVADPGNPVHMTGTQCSPQPVNGYYTCQFLALETGAYTIVFDPVVGYNTPTTVELMLDTDGYEVLKFYSTFPSGTVAVNVVNQDGTPITPPAGTWEVQYCTSEDPADCSGTPMLTGGGSGMATEQQYGIYRVFADTLPAGYESMTISPTAYDELSAQNDYIGFTLTYTEEGAQPVIEVTAEKNGTAVTDVEFYYCVGTYDGSFICDPAQNVPYNVAVLESGDQFLFVSREAGYGIPENTENGENAIDVAVTGFEDYYVYVIEADDIANEAINMSYLTVTQYADIEVTVEGPDDGTFTQAYIEVDRVGGSNQFAGNIANHATEVVNVEANGIIDYEVTCNEVNGYEATEDIIPVDDITANTAVTCEYTAIATIAYINVPTYDVTNGVGVNAQVHFIPETQTQYDTTNATSVSGANGNLLATADRFMLAGQLGDLYVDEDFEIICMPTIGGLEAPQNAINMHGGYSYPLGAETNLYTTHGQRCEYTAAAPEDVVTITIDTVGVEDAAISVDGIEVRSNGNSDAVQVDIAITDDHVISFEQQADPNYTDPADIEIPAGSLTEDANFVGYYVETGYETAVNVNTVNEDGYFGIEFASNPGTVWFVGLATVDPTAPLIVNIDERIAQNFHFEDKNPEFVLRAVPVAYAGFIVDRDVTAIYPVVSSFQEYYMYDGSQDFTEDLWLIGHYIDFDDAAFFRAQTINADVYGDIAITTGPGNDLEDLSPGAPATWTRYFVADVTDGDDNVEFESPVLWAGDGQNYVAIPDIIYLHEYADDLINGINTFDITSEYVTGIADVYVYLVSTDPSAPQPTAGLDVIMDGNETVQTAEVIPGTVFAPFFNVDITTAHNVVCPSISGLAVPNEVYIPADTMEADVAHDFYCLYAPEATAAEIEIQTSAHDVVNFEAQITLEVDGVPYNVGYTNGSDPMDVASMRMFVDSDSTNIVDYEAIAGYSTPDDSDVAVTPGTSPDTNPDTNIFLGYYGGVATINVYTADNDNPPLDGVDDAVITITDIDTGVSTEIAGVGDTGIALDVQVDPNTDYRIDFGAHPTDPATYTAPQSIFFNLEEGDTANYAGIYVETANLCETQIARYDSDAGTYLNAEVILTYDSQFSLGTGDPANNYLVTFNIDGLTAEGTYILNFENPINPASGAVYENVDPSSLSLPENGMICPAAYTILYYDDPIGTDTADFNITVLEMDADGGAVENAEVFVNALPVQTTDASGETAFADVPVDADITISFGAHPTDPSFTTPNDIVFMANQLEADLAYDITVYYVPTANAITLSVMTVDENDHLLFVDGEINLIVNDGSPLLYGYGVAEIIVSNDQAYSYQIDWGPTSPASQYIEPINDPQAVDSDVAAGTIVSVLGEYRMCPSVCSVVDITAYEDTIDPSAILASTITIDGTPVSTNGEHTGTYEVGTVIEVEFEDPVTHQTPMIYVDGAYVSTGHTYSHTVATDRDENDIDALYVTEANVVAFNIATQDEQGTELNEDYTAGNMQPHSTPDTFVVDAIELVSYTISFASKAGYIAPEDIVIDEGEITVIPEGVIITNSDGTDYVAGTELQIGETYDIMGTYEPRMLVEKEITNEETIVNNNKRVDYTITVTRNGRDLTPDDLTITLHDVLSDNNQSLIGDNGGVMNAVLQGNDYSVCSNGCGDIAVQDVDVTISNPGNSVTITYQLLSDNSSIPTTQTSFFINTVTGTYTDTMYTGNDTNVVTHMVGELVTVSAPPAATQGGGGGGGGGGGHILLSGDMMIEFEKLVSTDNSDFTSAPDEASAISIEENQDTRLYNKVTLTNLGQVSATDIEISQGFDGGASDMTADALEDFESEDAEYDEETGMITIDKIVVGGTVTFTYSVLVHENGESDEYATEYVELLGFESALPASQDGLTYLGVGEKTETYLIAGDPNRSTSPATETRLGITVESSVQEAAIGDPVTFTITIENLTDEDMTGIVLTHDYYEAAFDVNGVYGGRDDGRAVTWSLAMLRPGETAAYQVDAVVADTAPAGSEIYGMTRALVNEFDGIAPVKNTIRIAAGAAPVTEMAMQLAQTGPAQMLLLLIASVLAYLGYSAWNRRRYVMLKRAALEII
ncbi:hypothetical protein KKF04_02150 [Patescibacteria group bacterium]|nr:hypothetical protein [Patescibacteria group bacterium]